MNNLKIGVRLGLGFGLVLTLMLVIVAVSFGQLARMRSKMSVTSRYGHQANLATPQRIAIHDSRITKHDSRRMK